MNKMFNSALQIYNKKELPPNKMKEKFYLALFIAFNLAIWRYLLSNALIVSYSWYNNSDIRIV